MCRIQIAKACLDVWSDTSKGLPAQKNSGAAHAEVLVILQAQKAEFFLVSSPGLPDELWFPAVDGTKQSLQPGASQKWIAFRDMTSWMYKLQNFSLTGYDAVYTGQTMGVIYHKAEIINRAAARISKLTACSFSCFYATRKWWWRNKSCVLANQTVVLFWLGPSRCVIQYRYQINIILSRDTTNSLLSSSSETSRIGPFDPFRLQSHNCSSLP